MRPPRFDPETEASEMVNYLDEYGYVVIRRVANPKQVEDGISYLWDFLESVPSTRVRRNDITTWGQPDDWLSDPGNGIINGFGFGQSKFVWHNRLLPRVKLAFSKVWEDNTNLISSFDGGNVFLPYTYNVRKRSYYVSNPKCFPLECAPICPHILVCFTTCSSNTL